MNTKLAELRYMLDEGRYRKIVNEVITELKEKSEAIRKKTLRIAETLGTRKEFIAEDELKSRIANICGEYRKLKEIIGLGFNSSSQGLIGKNDADRYNSQINELEQKLSDLNNKRSLDPGVDTAKPEELEWYEPLIKWVPLGILLCEAVWEGFIFRLALGSLLFALPFAVGLGFARYLIVKEVVKKLVKLDQLWKKVALVGVVMLIAGIFYYQLGLFRAGYYERIGDTVEITPGLFLFISLMLLGGAIAGELYALYKKPIIQEKQAQLREYEKIQERDTEIVRLENSITDKKEEKDTSLQLRVKNMASSDTFLNGLKDEYESTVAEFKAVYLQFRAGRDNGVVPDYFKNVHVPDVVDEEDWSPIKRQNRSTNLNEKIEDHEN